MCHLLQSDEREQPLGNHSEGKIFLVGRSATQRAANESTFREANEKIEVRTKKLDLTDRPTPYLCECDDQKCTTIVRLTVHAYEAVRANPRQFLIARKHESAEDRVLDERERFTIVEKTGEEGQLVEARDPRG
jgi:hypothetical protein